MAFYPSSNRSRPALADFNRGTVRPGDTPPLPSGWMMRYANSIRFTDLAVIRLFSDIHIVDRHGAVKRVPIIMGTQERAVSAILGPNVRLDGSGQVDRVNLPLMALTPLDIAPDETRFGYPMAINWQNGNPIFGTERTPGDIRLGRSRCIPIIRTYTLFAWTKYIETMNQILEQVLHKFRPQPILNVEGVDFEVPVYLDSIANSIPPDVGDGETRIIKHEFTLRVESGIANTWIKRSTIKRVRTSTSLESVAPVVPEKAVTDTEERQTRDEQGRRPIGPGVGSPLDQIDFGS